MKFSQPKPFTFEGGERAVLLLHGFTGHTGDVRLLGRYLERRGYTCHAPQYKGHGVPPEQLVHTGPSDWWKDVVDGYNHLRELGHEKIAVVGLSLGGLFSLKISYTYPVVGVVPMCAPMFTKSEEVMYHGVLRYARACKVQEGKSPEQINEEMLRFKETPMNTLKSLRDFMKDIHHNTDMVYAPLFVVQARHDEMIDPASANIIFDEAQSSIKKLKFYEESGHVITIDKERDILNEDIYQFLESLEW
ncbi:MAG: alpha/beta hydrolase [Bacillaceae bacterium]